MSLPSRQAETTSVRSSVTEDDLEEARQRLLDHIEVNSSTGNQRYDEAEEDEVLLNGHTPHYVTPAMTTTTATTTTLPPNNFATVVPTNNAMGLPQQQWPANYGSVATVSLTSQATSNRKPPSTKRYRIPFLILLVFDWGLTILFSLVVMDKKNSYFSLDIDTDYFDLVVIATFRVSLNFLFYLILGWVTRLVMALTTLVSVLYLPIKAYYAWDTATDELTIKSIAILLMLVVTFGMPWITAFFFEFKFLPAELARLEIPSWWKLKAWVWPQYYTKRNVVVDDTTPSLQDIAERRPMPIRMPRPRLSASTMSLDFRTPVGSSRTSPIPYEHDRHGDDELPPIRENDEFGASLEHHSPECDQNMSSEDLRFKHEALNVLTAFKNMTQSNEGWNRERVDGDLAIYSKTIDRKRVWKAECVFPVPALSLFNIVYPGDKTPEWNPQCGLNRTVYRVDESTDILYTITNPMGPVSCRDFVSVRQMERSGGRFYAASKSIVTAMKPEESGKVRAENGPCGYLVIPVSSLQSKLVWVLNSNLKGWLPQTVIDQTLTTVLTSTMEKLRAYIAQQHPPSPLAPSSSRR